jgi:hypothetical protein
MRWANAWPDIVHELRRRSPDMLDEVQHELTGRDALAD